jgi:GNAT superfamily N-acetyltransferase
MDEDLDVRYGYLTEPYLKEAAKLGAEAFLDSPGYMAMLPDDTDLRRSFLEFLFERNYWLRLESNACCCTFNGDELVGFIMLVKPGIRNVSLLDMLRVGMLKVPFQFGFLTIFRLLRLKDWHETREGEVLSRLGKTNNDIVHLERMSILPKYQGKGIGTTSLARALKEEVNFPCLLNTQSESNVKFYMKLGFTVIDHTQVPLNGGFPNWMMIWEPTTEI